MVVELSYCADRCWVDVGEASPVREMALQPLLEASGVLAEQHAKAVADGADLFCLPVTPPDEPSAAAAAAPVWPQPRRVGAYCSSAEWGAFVDACTKCSGEAVHGFLSLAARPADCERLRASALRVLAARSRNPPGSGQDWIKACTQILNELQRDLVQVYLQQETAGFAARRRCVFQYAESALLKQGRSFDIGTGVVADTPRWNGALEPMRAVVQRDGDFAEDCGIIADIRSVLITCIHEGLRCAQASSLAQHPRELQESLDADERELLPWMADMEFPPFRGSRGHGSLGLLALAEAYDAPAVQAAVGPLLAVRHPRTRGFATESSDLFQPSASFCAVCHSDACSGARPWLLYALKATCGSRQSDSVATPAADVEVADTNAPDPWIAVRSWSELQGVPRDDANSETASQASAASDETFFSTLSLHSCHRSLETGDGTVPRRLEFIDDREQSGGQSISVRIGGGPSVEDTASHPTATDNSVFSPNGYSHVLNDVEESTTDCSSVDVAPATVRRRHGSCGAMDDEMEYLLMRVSALSEAALARDVREVPGTEPNDDADTLAGRLQKVRSLRKQIVIAQYAAMGTDEYAEVKIPFLVTKAALARINCETEDEVDATEVRAEGEEGRSPEGQCNGTLVQRSAESTIGHSVSETDQVSVDPPGKSATQCRVSVANSAEGEPQFDCGETHLTDNVVADDDAPENADAVHPAEVEEPGFTTSHVHFQPGVASEVGAAPLVDSLAGPCNATDDARTEFAVDRVDEHEHEGEGAEQHTSEPHPCPTTPLPQQHAMEQWRPGCEESQQAKQRPAQLRMQQQDDAQLQLQQKHGVDTVAIARRRAVARAARRLAESKAEAEKAQGGQGEAVAARREALAKLEAAAAIKRVRSAEAAKNRTRHLRASLVSTDTTGDRSSSQREMKSVQLGQQVLPIGSPDPMAENEATREGHADAQRRAQRERERARVAAKALAAMRTADETAKTAREQSRWAKRDERLALYQQARIARQVTERAPDHEEQRSNTGQT